MFPYKVSERKMAKEITKPLEQEEWYEALIEDLKAIITEGIFRSRMELIEAHHKFGERTLKENHNFKRARIYGQKIVQCIAQSTGRSTRAVWQDIQFAKKVKDLEGWINTLEEGKNLSWYKITQKYLAEPKEEIPFPKGKYRVIYADPPWPYPKRQDFKKLYGNIDHYYETMKIKEICDMKVSELADENSVLFLWVATNFLEESFEVIKSWGFDDKSQMVWIKKGGQGGIGWYFWGDHELLLVATKGSCLPAEKFSSVLEAPRREHSRKPDEIYGMIEKMYPKGKYIELFARTKRKGWDSWGDEIEKYAGN